MKGILEMARGRFKDIIEANTLADDDVSVLVKTITPEEAIGKPGRRDFPIIEGTERVIESEFRGARAHVFTDFPGEFIGKIKEVASSGLNSNKERALFLASLNALLKSTGYIRDTIHCRDEEPEKCAREIAAHIYERYGSIKVGLIGLNPAIAESLVSRFGKKNIRITDRNGKNIGTTCFDVEIWDASRYTERLVKTSDLILLTGTTMVNGTFDHIFSLINSDDKSYFIYGVTASGVCALAGLNRICFYSKEA